MISELYTVALTLREARRKLHITVGVIDLVANVMCKNLATEDDTGDFDSELFLAVAGVRT